MKNNVNAMDDNNEESSKFEDAAPSKDDSISPISMNQLQTISLQQRPSLLYPLLPVGSIIMIYGPPGCSKTLLASAMALAVASGSSLLKWHAPCCKSVMYVDGEMPLSLMRERLNMLAEGMGISRHIPLGILSRDILGERMPDLSTVEGQRALEIHISDIDLVIIDNIATLCGGSDQSAQSWLPVQNWAIQQRSRGKVIIFLHHPNKTGGQRGTCRRVDILDVVIRLERPRDYRSEDGARAILSYDKARHLYGDMVKPIEIQLVTRANGKVEWIFTDLEY